MRLGIGNTTALDTDHCERIAKWSKKLANKKTYTGYGDEQGNLNLRKALADFTKKEILF